MPAEGLSNGGLFEVKELEVTENGTYEEKGEMYNKVIVNVEGGGGEFKIANITWVNLPETFDNYDFKGAVLEIKTEEGFEGYNDIYEFGEVLLQWDDEWITAPKAIVTTKQPENVGDLAVWIQPYQDHDFSVVSGDAFIWSRGVILYGDCTLTLV